MDDPDIGDGKTEMKNQWIRIDSSQAEKKKLNCARAIKENESTNWTMNKV